MGQERGKLTAFETVVPLVIPNLPVGVTVKVKTDELGASLVTATLTLYGCSYADSYSAASLESAARRAIKAVQRYARWGNNLGAVLEVAPDLGIRFSNRGRIGLVTGRDIKKRTATVRWDDGESQDLAFAIFASDDTERV